MDFRSPSVHASDFDERGDSLSSEPNEMLSQGIENESSAVSSSTVSCNALYTFRSLQYKMTVSTSIYLF
jgi:hypothetical protein